MGDPRSPGPGQGQGQFTDKLSGRYSFSFTMSLPKKVNFNNKQHMKDLRLSGDEDLPPSLSGRSLGASINYELVVDVKRRGILNVGSAYVVQSTLLSAGAWFYFISVLMLGLRQYSPTLPCHVQNPNPSLCKTHTETRPLL